MIGQSYARGALILFAVLSLLVTTYAATTRSITVEAMAIDVGVVKQGQNVVRRFRVLNDGNSRASIVNVAPSCGVFAERQQPKALEPGEEDMIEVILRTAFVEPVVRRTVTVIVRDPFERTISLEIKGSIEPEFVIGTSVLDLGHVNQGEVVRRTLNIRKNNTKSRIVAVRSTEDIFTPYLERSLDGETVNIVVSADGRGPAGMKFGTIRIATSSPHMPELIVPVRTIVLDGQQDEALRITAVK